MSRLESTVAFIYPVRLDLLNLASGMALEFDDGVVPRRILHAVWQMNGHWLQEHRPVREERQCGGHCAAAADIRTRAQPDRQCPLSCLVEQCTRRDGHEGPERTEDAERADRRGLVELGRHCAGGLLLQKGGRPRQKYCTPAAHFC